MESEIPNKCRQLVAQAALPVMVARPSVHPSNHDTRVLRQDVKSVGEIERLKMADPFALLRTVYGGSSFKMETPKVSEGRSGRFKLAVPPDRSHGLSMLSPSYGEHLNIPPKETKALRRRGTAFLFVLPFPVICGEVAPAAGTQRWSELPDSRYDQDAQELVGTNLEPGLYSAFGWSANPVENALQRMVADATLGYRSRVADPDQGEEDGGLSATSFLVRAWLAEVSFSYRETTCETKDNPDCPENCQRAAGRVTLSSCRVDGVECPEPDCCECVTGTVTERFTPPPLSPIDIPLTPCPGPQCPICPDGLSCPTGPFVGIPSIAPTLELPDYAMLEGIGLGFLTDDPALREAFKEVVEETIGVQYPVPPPWPWRGVPRAAQQCPRTAVRAVRSVQVGVTFIQ